MSIERAYRSKGNFFGQATGPEQNQAGRLQDLADAQSALAKLQSLRLKDATLPADAVVITDTTFAVIHDPIDPHAILDTHDGTAVIIQSILDSRPIDARLIDILSQLKDGVMTGELPRRLLSSIAVFDRTTSRNPLGARRSTMTVRNIVLGEIVIPTYILSKKAAFEGTIDWA